MSMDSIRGKTTRLSILLAILATCLVWVTGCGTGPTKRSVDGDWNVSENICSSDPSEPDKGDMRSEIRVKIGGASAQRVVNFYHLDKTILILKNQFTGGGMSGEITVHENSPDNEVKEILKARNAREINEGIKSSISGFFDNDPDIDGDKAASFCLFRGQ